MASTQISRIQVRRGLQENLPNLAAGEIGWAVDSRRLFIGNGPLSEGAPAEGVTEILTELELNNLTGTISYPSASFTLAADQPLATLSPLTINNTEQGATVEYTMTRDISGTVEIRKGTFHMGHVNSKYVFEDEFLESANIGVTLGVAYQDVTNSAMTYISANIGGGNTTTFTYSLLSQM